MREELRASATSMHRPLPRPKIEARRRSRQQDRQRAESGSNAACRPCLSSIDSLVAPRKIAVRVAKITNDDYRQVRRCAGTQECWCRVEGSRSRAQRAQPRWPLDASDIPMKGSASYPRKPQGLPFRAKAHTAGGQSMSIAFSKSQNPRSAANQAETAINPKTPVST